jgi:hypothetical protein
MYLIVKVWGLKMKKENDGFLVLYTAFKDALIQKMGS